MAETQFIISSTLNFILETYQYELKAYHLTFFLPQFTTQLTSDLYQQMLQISNLSITDTSKLQPFYEQEEPINTTVDVLANCHLQSQKREINIQDKMPLALEKTRISFRGKISPNKKQKQLTPQKKQMIALTQPILSPEQNKIQNQIIDIKKHLYFSRRLRKQNQQEQKKRLEEISNRKSPPVPKKDFTFDFGGQFLFKKKLIHHPTSIFQLNAKPQQISQNEKKKKFIENQQSQRDYLISRNQTTSRLIKRKQFSNNNGRQLSHLPFIKLAQNSKLSESARVALGPDTSRYTLKSYQSRGQSSFKHHSQIQKQKSDRLYSLKKSCNLSEITEPEVNEEVRQTAHETRRQSKKMQKYLKQLHEDRTKDIFKQINKSCNFDKLNSPHDFPVHRYYKHNFDDDKKSICEQSLASLRIYSHN